MIQMRNQCTMAEYFRDNSLTRSPLKRKVHAVALFINISVHISTKKMLALPLLLLLHVFGQQVRAVVSLHHVLSHHHIETSRRDWIQRVVSASASVVSSAAVAYQTPIPCYAAAAVATASSTNNNNNKNNHPKNVVVSSIQEAQQTLGILLDNWARASVMCNYADIPRDLLSAENKQELLDKASTYALFDKSVSVETCKTSNRLVRDYLGLTGKGPLVGIDKKIRAALEYCDPDTLDDYIVEMERFSQSMARATSLSYTAGTADFDSVNNFSKTDTERDINSNLEQSRRAIQDAKASLDHIVTLLLQQTVPTTTPSSTTTTTSTTRG